MLVLDGSSEFSDTVLAYPPIRLGGWAKARLFGGPSSVLMAVPARSTPTCPQHSAVVSRPRHWRSRAGRHALTS